MKIIPFNRKHLEIMEAREHERECVIPYLNDVFLTAVEKLPYCYTVIADGRIVTCMGVFPLWEGVGEVWQLPSIYVGQYRKEYCKLIRAKLDEVARSLGLWRLQSPAPADELHDRWMKFVGFTCEGTMTNYTRFKKDYRLWAKGY